MATASGYSILNIMAMTKAKAVCIGAVMAVAAATPSVIEHHTNVRLKATVEALRRQLAQAQLGQQALVTTGSSELDQRRRDNTDLLRLRAEVTALRQRIASMANSSIDINEHLKAQKKQASEAEEAKVLLAKSPEIPMVAAHKWANVGFGTPADALQTLNWAIANQDSNAFGNALIWDEKARARAEELFAAAPEAVRQRYGSVDAVILDWWVNSSTPVAAGRVLSQIEEGSDEATLLEQHVYTDGRVRENTVQFQRDEQGAWRQVIPQELMHKLSVILNNLAGTSPVATK
jgi:hypothetical protein